MNIPILIFATLVIGAACFPRDSRVVLSDRQRRSTPEHESTCTPGTSFEHDDGCNTCYCHEQGRVTCTAVGCIKPGSELYKLHQMSRESFGQRQRRQVKQPECTPGTTFKDADDCNTCYCDEQGRAACTQKLCIKKDSVHYQKIQLARDSTGLRQRRQIGQPECTPGTTFRDADDCNDCFCTEDGRAACTLKACIKPGSELYQMLQKARESSGQRQRRQVEQPECTPGTTFRDADDCNDCFCTENGRAACTQKACIKPGSELYQMLQKARESSGQRQRRQVKQPECTPGTTFRDADDCNDCFCTEHGHAACTEKACVPNFEKAQP